MNFVKVYMHPKWHQEANNNDLAIFQFLEPIQKFTQKGYLPQTTLPVCVPQLSQFFEKLLRKEWITNAAFYRTSLYQQECNRDRIWNI